MNNNDLTRDIKALYEKQINQEIFQEAQVELERTGLANLVSEVDLILTKFKQEKIIQFPSQVRNFASTTLMAAAGQSLGNWFDHPIAFPSSGFLIDIRKIQGTSSEADIYIEPLDQDAIAMKRTFSSYKGKNLNIQFLINDRLVFDAEVYVDESGQAAEGIGKFFTITSEQGQGRLSIDIKVED